MGIIHENADETTSANSSNSQGIAKLMDALTEIELKQLEKAETQISTFLSAFTKSGSELAAIRDNRLYREKHKTWAEYCRQRWGFSVSYADRLIAAAKFAEDKLTPNGVEFRCEGELRELVSLTEAQFTKALGKARKIAETDELPLTATLVAKQLPKKRRKKDKDEKVHLTADISGKLEALAAQVDTVIKEQDAGKSLELLQRVYAFFDELKK